MNVYLRTRRIAGPRLSFYLDFYPDNGRRFTKSLGLSIPEKPKNVLERAQVAEVTAEAKRRQAEAYTQAAHGITPGTASSVTVAEYCLQIAGTKKKSSTSWKWKHLEKHLSLSGIGRIHLAKLSPAECTKFRTYLLGELMESSASVVLSSFRTMLRQAYNDEIIKRDLSGKIKPIKRNMSEVQYLDQSELDRLLSTPIDDREIRRAFAFSCMTGLRFSDIKELDWGTVKDFGPGTLSVIQYRIIKTGRKHEIYMDEQTREWLGAHGKGKVFNLPSQQTVNAKIDKWAKSAGIEKKVRYHVSRHTYGTLALLKLGNLKLVGDRMGHTTTQQTEVYARIIDDQKKLAAGAVKTSARVDMPDIRIVKKAE